jgi:Alpha-L-arabinofuranosidase B (ABFB) domain
MKKGCCVFTLLFCYFTGTTQTFSFQTVNYSGFYWRHIDSKGVISKIQTELDQKDASFRIVRGINTYCNNCISFESTNYPGYFLCQSNFSIILTKPIGHEGRKFASFRRVKGLAGVGFSYESDSVSNYYIRHANSKLVVAPRVETDLYKKDASFYENVGFYNPANPGSETIYVCNETKCKGSVAVKPGSCPICQKPLIALTPSK